MNQETELNPTTKLSSLEIVLLPCRTDNYAVLIHDPISKNTAAIDAPDGALIHEALQQRGWYLTHLFITPHHHDHIEGIPALNAHYNATIFVPEAESTRILGIIPRTAQVQSVRDNDEILFGHHPIQSIVTAGHTLGHVCYYWPQDALLFSGDPLFSMGCGRLFEGTPQQMWHSLKRLRELPPATQIYCGHEYTHANGLFALTIEPENADLKQRRAEVEELRAHHRPTMPVSLAQECATNPFLRADEPSVKRHLAMTKKTDEDVFAHLRRLKDQYKI